jgi:hypothetical protein
LILFSALEMTDDLAIIPQYKALVGIANLLQCRPRSLNVTTSSAAARLLLLVLSANAS